jgi:hypothetical protein
MNKQENVIMIVITVVLTGTARGGGRGGGGGCGGLWIFGGMQLRNTETRNGEEKRRE